ncbi:MAG TPA: DUF4209 domain-containing protein [Bacteroidia bacterium]|nr:DUF4209 domain-containing protein [Bacteroidia bacterium]
MDSDFEYIQSRYAESSNLYFKSEYGLVLYLSGHNRHNDFKYELASKLFSLSQTYYQAFQRGSDKYFTYYFRKLESAAKGFPDDDKYFFKYILTEKSGWNLRHRTAHGLIDSNEYDIMDAIGLLLIILRISSYKFINHESAAASSEAQV